MSVHTLHTVPAHAIKPNETPLPRKRTEIESSAFLAAKEGSTCGLLVLLIGVALDVRDLVGECAVGLSTIEAEVRKP